ncbi:hypothetical protein HID58_065826 [Brassica napus]|uniref:AMP-activated protein kinase glycogen-binding domain-containing protein n=3 Tax=Brassica TaxID=3705 RepID=A0ABQ7ZDY2_BRANA|nr:hypothetical protein HID58_065826 [Brassica napus]
MAPTATATATATSSSDASEGPVMGLINKRLRALRKKLNRITQMEESISQGKTLNKEQQEVLRSKPSVLVLIEELDKLRAPLSAAVSEEITLATTHHHHHHNQAPPDQNEVADAPEEEEAKKLEDLVNLLYFGSLFDVKSQNELASIMLTRTHERGCCLVYDTVTDESTDLLCDKDLDLISELWTMMVSRPADSFLSHKNALERCVEHAKLWLANSDQPIASNCNVSYAGLREKLKKIMGSNYFTITPEMVAPVEAASAAAAGNYGAFQVAADTEQKEEDASNIKEQEPAVNDQSEQPKDESVTEGELVQGQQEQGYTQVEGGRSKRDYQQQYVPRGTHQNQRGHRGARRGHSNAPRGGRGGGGGYSNGRYESYDNSGGNGYQRSHYNNRGRGRGGGGGNGHSYNNNNNQDSNRTQTVRRNAPKMVSLNSGPVSSFAPRLSLIDSDTLLPLSSFSSFNPICSGKLSLLADGKSCGPVQWFLEVKLRKKGCCFRRSGVLRMCNNQDLGWDSDKDLETEILEFMKNSDKPGMFPSKKDLIRSERFDLVERIVNQGGWLSMGWDLDEQQEEEVRVKENVVLGDLPIEKQLRNLSSNASYSREEVDGKNESGIEGILTRLEKERNLSLGINLSGKGESNGAMYDDITLNGSPPRSSIIVTASEFQDVDASRSSGEYGQSRYQEAKPVSGNNSSTSETWRTWSMRRAGFTDEDFEAAEISSSSLVGLKKDDTNKDSNGKDKTASYSEDINTTHIKSRLQNLQSELSSVLQSLRSPPPDEVGTSKDSEIKSGNLENLNDDWEFKENEIIYAQNKLRSTRAKLAVLEGKMSMAIIDAQRIVREKQRKIDHARRALRLLRTASIVWPNSASEVLLTGSFDGWSTQRKMKKAQNGVSSLTLKLYPGKYQIKFIVDGQWKVDPLRPIVTCDGYENNLLIIS